MPEIPLALSQSGVLDAIEASGSEVSHLSPTKQDETSGGGGGETRTASGIDDFEDGDLDEYSGVSSDATVQTGVVYEGTYALQLDAAASGSFGEIFSTSGLPSYPQAGDTFSYKVRISSTSATANSRFGLQSSGNSYRIRLHYPSNSLNLQVISGGSVTAISTDTFSSKPTNEWLTVEVVWGEGGSINVSVTDAGDTTIASVSGTDATYSSGGVGWVVKSASGSVTSYFDAAQITATTSGTGVIDDFEDGDLSEYSGVSDYSVTTGAALVGTYGVKNDINIPARAFSSSGLDRYPQEGDTFEYQAKIALEDAANGNHALLYFGGSDSDNCYRIGWNNNTNQLRFFVRTGGSMSQITGASFTPSVGETYRTVINWGSGGTFTITVYDSSDTQQVQITATDTTYSSGGIGFRCLYGTQNLDQIQITQSGDQTATGVVDDFEDGDLTEYVDGYYGGTSTFATQSSTVYEGSTALGGDSSYGGGASSIISTSGLSRYPQAGDTFECRIMLDGQSHTYGSVWFGVQNAGGNEFEIDVGKDSALTQNLRLLRRSGGGGATIVTGQDIGAVPSNEWLRLKVGWGASGGITATLYDASGTQLGQISATDTTYSSGGVGYLSSSAGNVGTVTCWFDLYKLL